MANPKHDEPWNYYIICGLQVGEIHFVQEGMTIHKYDMGWFTNPRYGAFDSSHCTIPEIEALEVEACRTERTLRREIEKGNNAYYDGILYINVDNLEGFKLLGECEYIEKVNDFERPFIWQFQFVCTIDDSKKLYTFKNPRYSKTEKTELGEKAEQLKDFLINELGMDSLTFTKACKLITHREKVKELLS